MEMYKFRDKIAAEEGIDLKVFSSPKGIKDNINPIDNGSEEHTDITKTQALKIALRSI